MSRDLYTRLRCKTVYQNPWLAVEVHEVVHPSGAPGEHAVLVTPQSSAVVVADGNKLIFARQPRFAARRAVVEIVKGGGKPGEAPLDSAKRELREELGITAGRWRELGMLHEIPSIVEPPVALFLARDLAYGTPEPGEEENIDLVTLTIDEAVRAALGGKIDDAVTVAALFRFAAAYGYVSWPADSGS